LSGTHTGESPWDTPASVFMGPGLPAFREEPG